MVVADRGLRYDLRYVNALTAGALRSETPHTISNERRSFNIDSSANHLRTLSAAGD